MRQAIPDATTTELAGRPGVFAYQDSGEASWVEARDDGALVLGPLPDGHQWSLFQNSGSEALHDVTKPPPFEPADLLSMAREVLGDHIETLKRRRVPVVAPEVQHAVELAREIIRTRHGIPG